MPLNEAPPLLSTNRPFCDTFGNPTFEATASNTVDSGESSQTTTSTASDLFTAWATRTTASSGSRARSSSRVVPDCSALAR
eukprot:CAMPEP_0171273368 /NCGR_PEP_ID=MMETSP0790-20130122/62249_1 /TAXON_ID=2925 /ORGANISM="Alexandrium catenella, Strain OF101" /LENGTH=80 /DNA_ID=CAMNT_0011742355 /DNA_START=120 /DNA_END=358 /DNA_ORIENTATION=+